MTAFEQLLKDLKALSINKAEQGARFEKLIKQFLLTDRLYAEQYEKVWLWAEFPYRSGHDIDPGTVLSSVPQILLTS